MKIRLFFLLALFAEYADSPAPAACKANAANIGIGIIMFYLVI